MNKLLITTAMAALLVATPAFAHKKKEKHVECLVNEVYDAETNSCLPILNDNDSFLDVGNTDTDTDTDTDTNKDTHHHGKGHEKGRGHFEHGNGKGLGHYK